MGKDLTIEQQVKNHRFFEKTDFGKIRCILTGHELPMRETDFLEYQTVTTKIYHFTFFWLPCRPKVSSKDWNLTSHLKTMTPSSPNIRETWTFFTARSPRKSCQRRKLHLKNTFKARNSTKKWKSFSRHRRRKLGRCTVKWSICSVLCTPRRVTELREVYSRNIWRFRVVTMMLVLMFNLRDFMTLWTPKLTSKSQIADLKI